MDRAKTPPTIAAPELASEVRSRAPGRRPVVLPPEPEPERGSLLPFFGIGALFLLVVVALHLSWQLKVTLEDQLADRLRVSAELASQLVASGGLDAAKPSADVDPEVLLRLEEIRNATSVSEIVLYDWNGALVGGASQAGIGAAVPKRIRVAQGGTADPAGRPVERDAAGGLTLVIPLGVDAGAGALLTRIDRERQGGLPTADFLFQIAKVLAGVVTASGVLILLRWIVKGGPEPARPRVGTTQAHDVDLVLGTVKEVMTTLKDSESEYRDRMTAAEEDADLTRRTNDLIVESMGSGLVAFDRVGRITMFNRGAERIFGFERRAALGRRVAEVFGATEAMTRLAKEVLEEERPAEREELEVETSEGESQWLGVSSSVLRDADGRAHGGILLVADLTETKRLRDAGELQDRLAAIGEMSAGIAHEIKNVLHSLLGYANLLEEDHRDTEPPLAVRGILDDVRSLEALVQGVLAFGRPSQLAKEETDVNALLRQTLEGVSKSADEAGVQCELDLDDALDLVELDREAIRGVLRNLALNAVQAMETDGGALVITTRPTELAGERGYDDPATRDAVRISFRDNGPGIPEAERRKVFTPFWSTKREGNGLGLALSHKTITDHGGRITLHSREGVGTEFILVLPRRGGTA